MSVSHSLSRRQFLRGALTLGAAAALGGGSFSPAPRAYANGIAPVRAVPDAGRRVALTYDDLWNEFYTFRIARAYHKRGVSITLFPAGRAVRNNNVRPHEGYEDMYAKMRDMGHDIGCHLHTHRDIRDFDLEQLVEEEMEPSLEAMRLALGADFTPVGIRPPYGVMTDAVRELAALYGIPLILWGVDLPRRFLPGAAGLRYRLQRERKQPPDNRRLACRQRLVVGAIQHHGRLHKRAVRAVMRRLHPGQCEETPASRQRHPESRLTQFLPCLAAHTGLAAPQ